MELRKLRYFYTVAQFGHVTKAAESIPIAQPALTQAIRSLEEELGVPLFRKQGRNVVLTEYGEYLKTRLDRLLPEFDALPEELASLRDRERETVKLNILAASTRVIELVAQYRTPNGNVRFAIEQNTEQHDSDIVITTDGCVASTSRVPVERTTIRERIYLAVPKDSRYAMRSEIALSEVREEGFVMLSGSRLFGGICNRLCAEAGFYPRILFASDAPAAVQNIIGTGMGISFWPEFSFGTAKNENVILLPISSPDCTRNLILERYVRTPHSAAAEDFYRYLLQNITKRAGDDAEIVPAVTQSC